MTTRAPVRIALAQFEDIVAHGLSWLIREDENLELVAAGIDHDELVMELAEHEPNVAILNFGSLRNASELRDLHRRFPTRSIWPPAASTCCRLPTPGMGPRRGRTS